MDYFWAILILASAVKCNALTWPRLPGKEPEKPESLKNKTIFQNQIYVNSCPKKHLCKLHAD